MFVSAHSFLLQEAFKREGYGDLEPADGVTFPDYPWGLGEGDEVRETPPPPGHPDSVTVSSMPL